MWDLSTGRELFSVFEPVRIWGLAFDQDGDRFATGAYDGVLRLWDAETGQKLLELPGHASTIVDIRFSPDGEYIATSSSDRTAIVRDAHTGKELVILTGHTGIVSGVPSARTARVWQLPAGMGQSGCLPCSLMI
jgi:WD40 repeat protein